LPHNLKILKQSHLGRSTTTVAVLILRDRIGESG
jgi:hypothetical protein